MIAKIEETLETISNHWDPPAISRYLRGIGVSRQGAGMNGMTKHWGIAILRVMLAIVYLSHGGQKLFTYGFSGVQGAFAHMGIPMPTVMGPFIALLEFVGGALLALGVGVRCVSILLAIEMAVAVFKVHLPNGFFMPNGYEYALTLFAANCCLALEGAGAASVRIVGKKTVPAGS
jgi:putative oxidoreductase